MSGLETRTKIVVDPATKQKRFVAAQAVKLAKALNDPLYQQYIMHLEKAKEYKRKIILKYARNIIEKMKQSGVHVKINPQDFVQEE